MVLVVYFYEFIVYMLLERNAFNSIAFFSQCRFYLYLLINNCLEKMEKILFCGFMSNWPAIKKLFNSGTYLLTKNEFPKHRKRNILNTQEYRPVQQKIEIKKWIYLRRRNVGETRRRKSKSLPFFFDTQNCRPKEKRPTQLRAKVSPTSEKPVQIKVGAASTRNKTY